MKDIETIYTRKIHEAEMFMQKAMQERPNTPIYDYWMTAAEKATDQAEGAKWVIHLLNGRVAPISYN